MRLAGFARTSEHVGKSAIWPSSGIAAGRKPREPTASYQLDHEIETNIIVSWDDAGGLCAVGNALLSVSESMGNATFEARSNAISAIKTRLDKTFQARGFQKKHLNEMAPETGAYYLLDDRKAHTLTVEWDDGDGLAVLGETISTLTSVEHLDAPDQPNGPA